MTDNEKNALVNEILATIRTNSRTIEQLTPTQTVADTDKIEISGGKSITFAKLRDVVISAISAQMQTYAGYNSEIQTLKTRMNTAEGSLSAFGAQLTIEGNTRQSADGGLQTQINYINGDISSLQQADEDMAATIASHTTDIAERKFLIGMITVTDVDDVTKGANGRILKVMNGGSQIGTLVTILAQSGFYIQFLFTPCNIDSGGSIVWNSFNGSDFHIWHRYYKNVWSPWQECAGSATLARIAALEGSYDRLDSRMTTLDNGIADEAWSRSNAINGLRSELNDAINAKATEIGTRINGVVNDYKAADTTVQSALQTQIDAVTDTITDMDADYKAADRGLSDAIGAVDSAYKAADTALQQTIENNLTPRITAVENKADSIDSAYKEADEALDSAYKAADTAVQNALQTQIDAVTDTITDMDADYKAADRGLSDAIGAVDSAYKAADTALQQTIENNLTPRITAVENKADSIDSAYKEADEALDAAYKAADTALQQSMSTLISAVNSKADGIDAAFKTADDELQAQIDSLSAQTIISMALSDTTGVLTMEYDSVSSVSDALLNPITGEIEIEYTI